MRFSLETPVPSAAEVKCRRPRSLFGKILHRTGWLVITPFLWLDGHRIKRGWSLIEELFGELRAASARDVSGCGNYQRW